MGAKLLHLLLAGLLVFASTACTRDLATGQGIKAEAPSDQEIITVFRSHQNSFERLKDMAIQDSNETSFITEAKISGKLSESRRQEYRQLFSTIGRGLRITSSDRAIRFIFASGGTSAIGPGWLKGIEFIVGDADKEGRMSGNLENVAALPTGDVYLRKVVPGWFLVVQKTD